MKMTCYPNSLDPQAVHSVKLWKKQMGTGLKRFCLMIYFPLQIYSSRQWQHMQNLSFLVRITLLIIPLVVMIRHKHLHSKEPYSVWTKTNTRSVIIFPSQIQDCHRHPLRWFNMAPRVKWRHRCGTDVVSSPTPNQCIRRKFQWGDLPVEVLLPIVKASSTHLPADIIFRSVSFIWISSSYTCIRFLLSLQTIAVIILTLHWLHLNNLAV